MTFRHASESVGPPADQYPSPRHHRNGTQPHVYLDYSFLRGHRQGAHSRVCLYCILHTCKYPRHQEGRSSATAILTIAVHAVLQDELECHPLVLRPGDHSPPGSSQRHISRRLLELDLREYFYVLVPFSPLTVDEAAVGDASPST